MARKMKDSGIEWIGEIPEDWKVLPFKKICKEFYSGGTPTASNPNYYTNINDGYPFINISDLTNNKYVTNIKKYITKNAADSKSLKIVDSEYILLAMYASVGTVSMLNVESYISQAILAIKPNDLVEKKFLYYFLDSFQPYSESYSRGTTQNNLSAEIIKNLRISIPNILEQKKISKYLEIKTQEIEDIKKIVKDEIENLENYKKSIITEAVTKGLDKDVEMKDSGIDWIGQIPKHWKVKRLKQLLSNKSLKVGPFGSALKSIDIVESGKWVYNQRTVLDENFKYNDTFINDKKYEELKSFKVEEGDVLLTTRGTIGKVAVVPHDFKEGVIHPCIIKFNLDKNIFKNELVKYIFNSTDLVLKQLVYLSNSTTIGVIYSYNLVNIYIPTAPIDEQKEILTYLNKKQN